MAQTIWNTSVSQIEVADFHSAKHLGEPTEYIYTEKTMN